MGVIQMKINIASVLKNEGASMDFSGTTEMGSFTFMGSPIEFAEDVSVKGTVLNIGGTIEVSADITGKYKTQCSRCCEDIVQSVECDLFESVRSDFSDADAECLSLCGTALDIDGAVKSCVFNSVPLKFLCSEDCKGLCPVCGTNLNKGECNCDIAVCDPRFAILRNLQQRGVENGSSEEKNF